MKYNGHMISRQSRDRPIESRTVSNRYSTKRFGIYNRRKRDKGFDYPVLGECWRQNR